MKKNFKKFLAVLTVFVMALGVVALPNATAMAAESGTYKTGQTWWGGGSFMVGYAAENSTIQELETQMGYWPDGGFSWWTAVVFDMQADGTFKVTEIIPADGSNDKANVSLKTGRVVVMYHTDITKDSSFANAEANKEFFDSLKVGDVCSALGMWGNEIDWNVVAKNEDQITFTKVEASSNAGSNDSAADNAGSSNAGSSDAGSTNSGSTNSGSTSNVPATGDSAPVAVMASMLLAAFACVALGLKKRNA